MANKDIQYIVLNSNNFYNTKKSLMFVHCSDSVCMFVILFRKLLPRLCEIRNCSYMVAG